MKRTSVICTMLIALIFPALVVGQGGTKSKAPQAGGVEQQLKQIEDDWTKANKNKDTAALRRIIAKDWVGTDEKGKVLNREPFISLIASNPDVIESNENFDMQVRVYGNTAVVTGGIKQKGTRNGTAYTDTSRWTDVFVKRGGRWQAVVSQWVKVP
jgi:ketosteroid isomerase-like protein